jgi:hypothetical protein
MTKLEAPLKRQIDIAGEAYTLTITPQGMTLAIKGRRKGLDLQWASLVSGEAALATALNASLTANLAGPVTHESRDIAPVKSKPKRKAG